MINITKRSTYFRDEDKLFKVLKRMTLRVVIPEFRCFKYENKLKEKFI